MKSQLLKQGGLILLQEWIIVLALIFGGCCSNVYSLEMLVKSVPSSGNLITFAQFLFVSVEGLYSHIEFQAGWIPIKLKERKIPLYRWLVMVVIFWTVSVLNNYALAFNVPMPLHIIFRSASLIVSMFLGWLFFGRTFTTLQVVGVVGVTIGVILSTIGSSSSKSSEIEDSLQFAIGLGVLVLTLILSCFMGQYQQITYAKYGKHWKEGLFYNHFLGLPPFLLFYNDLSTQFVDYNKSPPMQIPLFIPGQLVDIISSFRIPQLWLFLCVNVCTQFVCISGVSKLTSMTSSVTVNLILSIRKIISLLLSIYIFNNAFTVTNWVGAAFVFSGTVLYAYSSGQTASKERKVIKKRFRKSKKYKKD